MKKSIYHGFFCMLMFLLLACNNDLDTVNALFEERNADQEIAENIELIYSDSGRVVLKLTAPHMVRYLDETDKKQEFPDGIDVDFYDRTGKVNSHLISDYAIREEMTDDVIARENVVLYNLDGDTLKTDELTWSQKENRIYSDQFVRISTPKEIIYGFGFEADPGFTQFSLDDISGTMEVDNLPKN